MKRPLSLWLHFPRDITLLFAVFQLIPGAWAQPAGCYVRLEDASGYSPSSAQITELEAAAAGLAFYNQYPDNLLRIKINDLTNDTTIVVEEVYDGSNNY